MSKSALKSAPRAKRYPDTRAGAIQYLRDESSLDLRPTNIRSITSDPIVEGVWEVMLSDTQVIVYLAGYRDVWHRTRTENDFETADLINE